MITFNRRIKYAKEEIMLSYLYPRLDVKVSSDIGHLLKSPFCIHPKTGKVCVPLRIEDLDRFDPIRVPTLAGLENEVNNQKEFNIKKTSMNIYLQIFEDFV
jgi:DNA primase small subunit